MPDNAFTIGAVVDVADVQAGMTAAGEVTQEALDKMLATFQEASTGTARAVARISEDTRVAALEVDASWQEVARATLAYTSALKEVSAATYLARKAGEDDAVAVNLLAAAKEKAAAASIALSAAQKEAAGSAELEALSLKELAASATEIFEKFSSGLLGAGLLGGIFGHLANEAVDFSLQMRNLSGVTGITESTLAGLHDRVKEVGIEFDGVAASLGKLVKSQQDAIDGGAKQITGFNKIGISVDELKALSPEELLFRVAEGFQSVGSTAEKNAAAVDIMGKGGRVALEAFQAGGPTFRAWVEEAAKISGISDENTAAAFKWKGASEQLSVALRGLALEVLPSVVAAFPTLVAVFEGILAPIKTVIFAVTTFGLSVIEAFVGIGHVIHDVVTGNLKDIVPDATEAKDRIVAVMKSGGQDIADAWTKDGDAAIKAFGGIKAPPKPSGGPEDLPGAGGKDTRLSDWKAELQAKKDDEDGFHQLSKDAEAEFWTAKLATVKAGTKLYGEVLHEVRDAERASDKDALKDEVESVREKLAATKSGSAERVAILAEEVGHLKSIGAGQTAEYKRLQTELIVATRERAAEEGKQAVEAERQKIDGTRRGSEERVAAERAVLAELVALGLQGTAEYTKQQQRVTEAARQAAQERLKLEELEIEQAKIVGVSEVEIQRQNVQAEFDLHRINAQQRIAALKQLEDEEYEIQKAALEKKLVLMQQDPTLSPVQIQQLQNQIENLTRTHNDKIAALNTQAVKDSEQKYDQMWSHINSGFQNAINGMLTGTRTFAKGMQELWNSLIGGIIDSIAKMALQWIEQHLLMRAFSAIFHTQELAEDVASKTAQTAETSAANVAMAASDAAVAAAGALAWWSAVDPPAAPEMAAITYAEGLGYAGLAAFHGGGIALDEQLAVLKRNEMVLDPVLSTGFQKMLGGGDSVAPAGAGSGSSGAAGHSISFGDLNYSPTYNHPTNPAQDPSVIAKITRRKIARSVGINL